MFFTFTHCVHDGEGSDAGKQNASIDASSKSAPILSQTKSVAVAEPVLRLARDDDDDDDTHSVCDPKCSSSSDPIPRRL